MNFKFRKKHSWETLNTNLVWRNKIW